MSAAIPDADGGGGDLLVEPKTAVAVVKVIPWHHLFNQFQTLFSPRLIIVGPAAGGKSTLAEVLYNAGELIMIKEHKSSKLKVHPSLEIEFEGPLGKRPLTLRNVTDTPGQRGSVAEDVAIASPTTARRFWFSCWT